MSTKKRMIQEMKAVKEKYNLSMAAIGREANLNGITVKTALEGNTSLNGFFDTYEALKRLKNKSIRYTEMFYTQDEEWGVVVIGYSKEDALKEAQEYLKQYNENTQGDNTKEYLEIKTEPFDYKFKEVKGKTEEWYEGEKTGEIDGLVFSIIL